VAEQELTAKQASLAAVGLVVATTVGLVGASVSTGTAAAVWAVGTVVAISALAFRLRRAPSGTVAVTLLITGIVVLSAGIPAAAVLSESRGVSSSQGGAQPVDRERGNAAMDPSTELRRALDQADRTLPGGSDSVLNVRIDANSTYVTLLDLEKGQQVMAYYARSSDKWHEPSRTATNDRGDAVIRRSDIAGLDLTAAAVKVTAAAARLGVELKERPSDDITIARRSGDKRIVGTFDASDFEVEVDAAGNPPDNLDLAKVDGLFPGAEKLLRANGIDPAQAWLTDLDYRVYAPNASSVGNLDPGSLSITVDGGGRYGTLKQTVGKFPEVSLKPNRGTASSPFALASITPVAIERARADLAQRMSVPPVDAHAISLSIERDTSSAALRQRNSPPIMRFGLGPTADAYYRLDGTFVRAD
jgi:hypothetical protein